MLCVSVVLAVQGFFFADGGLTALGINIVLMAIIPSAIGWGIFQLVTRVARNRASVIAGSFVAALISVPIAALTFAVLFVLGGTAPIETGAVFAAMGGVHVLVGIGEGLITAVTVSSVLAVRPDLVYGARFLTKPLVLKTATGEQVVEPARPEPAKPLRPFLLGSVAVALVLAGVVSFFASSSPDGLERVAEDEGSSARPPTTPSAASPWPTTATSAASPVGVAGVIGVVITLLVGGAILWSVRGRRRRRREGPLPAGRLADPPARAAVQAGRRRAVRRRGGGHAARALLGSSSCTP